MVRKLSSVRMQDTASANKPFISINSGDHGIRPGVCNKLSSGTSPEKLMTDNAQTSAEFHQLLCVVHITARCLGLAEFIRESLQCASIKSM